MERMFNRQETSFWSFIQQHRIQIPIIQRDYAQGRTGKEDLRRSFLAKLRSALEKNCTLEDGHLILDFVYGSESSGTLNPLDGQQRLTTLWLLHWYIALRSGNLDEDTCKILGRFTYETRTSSRDFCTELCNAENFKGFSGKDIVGYIERKTWFYADWKHDPTVNAMLKMLKGTPLTKEEMKKDISARKDGIEMVFDDSFDFEEAWRQLTGLSCPIVFYYLPLTEFKLTDDLYLKMNARGKQLTSFENFKAKLSKYIKDAKWPDLDDKSSGLMIKMDTLWTDIFWKFRSKQSKIDDIYFAFINRFFLNELFRAKNGDSHLLKVGKANDTNTIENRNDSYRHLYDPEHAGSLGDSMVAFSTFKPYLFHDGCIPKATLVRLCNILDNYREYVNSGLELPVCSWAKDFHFIPQYYLSDRSEEIAIQNNKGEEVLRTTSLSQVYRIAFYALCKYFSEGAADDISLGRWMRFVWNLISNVTADGRPMIRTTQQMIEAMDVIESIGNTHDVYAALEQLPLIDLGSDIKRRLNDEIVKAKQIRSHTNARTDARSWESAIIDAENFSFFHGTIDFLYRDSKGQVNWDDFDAKFASAKAKFAGGQNNAEITDFAKYFKEEDLYAVWSSISFDSNNDNLWKTILSDNRFREQVHNFLMGTKAETPCKALSDIIDIMSACQCKELWILNNWNTCSHVLTNYSQRRNYTPSGYVYQIAGSRNSVLERLLEDNEISISYSTNYVGEPYYDVSGKKYFRGLLIYLSYEGRKYVFRGDCKICLVDEELNWVGESFDVDSNTTVDFIKMKMQELVR